MASEIRVNKIENRSGLGTVTFADTGVDLAGIVTATTFSGSGASLTNLPAANVTGTLPAISGANLTNLPAANLTGALPAISGANLTGIAATDNVRTGILDVAGISTFRNTMNVGTAVTISESGIEATGVGITVANINGGKIGGRRNIIINGAMEVAQRATSNTAGGDGYFTVDRMYYYNAGIDNDVTKAQAAVSSGTSPYSEGFRSCFKLTNGNQSSGAGTSDEIIIRQNIEAWDIAQSGWNYTSSSSFITLSYWIKSSVSQNFYVNLQTVDGTAQNYVTETGTLSADTWTKVVKTIPGNSNLQFDNNFYKGMHIQWNVFRGTTVTGTRPLNAWAAYSSSTRVPDMTSTWYTTNNATFEITGVQLEVGSQATPFEFRSYGEELLLCKRYYQRSTDSSRGSNYSLATSTWHSADGSHSFSKHNTYYDWKQNFEVEMRAAPTLTIYGSSNQGDIHLESIGVGSQEVDWNNNTTEVKTKGFLLRHIEDAVYTSGSGNGFGILAYTLDAEI